MSVTRLLASTVALCRPLLLPTRALLIPIGVALLGVAGCGGSTTPAEKASLATGPKPPDQYTHKNLSYDHSYDKLVFRGPPFKPAVARQNAIRLLFNKLYVQDWTEWNDSIAGKPGNKELPVVVRGRAYDPTLTFPNAAAYRTYLKRQLDSLSTLPALPFPSDSTNAAPDLEDDHHDHNH